VIFAAPAERPWGGWLEAALARMDLALLEQRVFLYLWNLGVNNDSCWPAVGTICKAVGRSERRVQAALNRLQDLGMLHTTWRKGGRGVTTEWRFPLGWFYRARGEVEKAEAEELALTPAPTTSQEGSSSTTERSWRGRQPWKSAGKQKRERRRRRPSPPGEPTAEKSSAEPALSPETIQAIWSAAWSSSALSATGHIAGEYIWPGSMAHKDGRAHRAAVRELQGLRVDDQQLRAAFDVYLEQERHAPQRGQWAGAPWGVFPFRDPPSLPKMIREARKWIDQGVLSLRRRQSGLNQGSGPGPPAPSEWAALPEETRQRVLAYLGMPQLTSEVASALEIPGYLDSLVQQSSG